MSIGRPKLIDVTAEATGLASAKCAEALDCMIDVMRAALDRNEIVLVDGFGSFQRGTKGQRPFYPAKALVERLNAEEHVPAVPTLAPKPVPLTLRPEDDAAIEAWLRARQGSDTSEGVGALFGQVKQHRYWSDNTARNARSSLRAFARRCPVPIVRAGLGDWDPSSLFTFRVSALNAEVAAYAEDFRLRHTPRLAGVDEDHRKGPIAWRTPAWIQFVGHAEDFYAWLEQQKLRPPGSNPLQGINRFKPLQAERKVLIVKRWYEAVLRYPFLSAKERGLIYLLGNGLRATEAGAARIEHLKLKQYTLAICGKNKKWRKVILQDWTVTALDLYLQSRRQSTSPWLFPARRGPISRQAVYEIVQSIAARVFPKPDQEKIRRHIHPHGFRHYFTSKAIERHIPAPIIMEVNGWKNSAMLSHYTSVDETTLVREIQRASKQPWF